MSASFAPTKLGSNVALSEDEWTVLLATLHDLADVSAAAIMPHFRAPLHVENKADHTGVAAGLDAARRGFDPVTVADKAGEAAIVAHLDAVFPHHAILGEEFGRRAGRTAAATAQNVEGRAPDKSAGLTGSFEWVIDPIDGTRAFVIGAPTWGTLIGLRTRETAVTGLMNQPFTGERFWRASTGSFAQRPDGSHVRLATSQERTTLDGIFVSTTAPELFSQERHRAAFEALTATARLTRYGLDCYAYCLLASGQIDLVIETGLAPYDIVALIAIIEGAGGCVTTWSGGSALNGGDIIATANPRLHAAALATLMHVA